MPLKVANSGRMLLVKNRQIARGGSAKKFLRGGAREEAEVAHHVRLIAVAGFKGDLRERLPGIPQPADMLQTGQTAEFLGRSADCGTKLSFERALTHGGAVRNRRDGRPAVGVADHLCGRLNLRGDCVLCTNSMGEKTLHGRDLSAYLASVGEGALDSVNLLPGQEVVERYGPVVKKIRAVMQDGWGANLSEPNDNQRGAGRVLDHAGSFLQTGDDGVRKVLVVQVCRAGLP
jgi:hypothetical protein